MVRPDFDLDDPEALGPSLERCVKLRFQSGLDEGNDEDGSMIMYDVPFIIYNYYKYDIIMYYKYYNNLQSLTIIYDLCAMQLYDVPSGKAT